MMTYLPESEAALTDAEKFRNGIRAIQRTYQITFPKALWLAKMLRSEIMRKDELELKSHLVRVKDTAFKILEQQW